MSDPRALFGELRTELQDLAESLAGYAPPPRPDGVERHNPHKLGPLWNVPPPAGNSGLDGHVVRVVEDGDPPLSVFVEGGQFSYGGDMEAFDPRRARILAMALLAAADWAEGHDELGQRRLRKEESA